MASLRVVDLTKSYNKKTVLDNINFTVNDGEFLSILGPSGCGKTTLLKILIGIETLDAGKIMKEDIDISKLDPSKRGMGIVFQNYSLFPNMTVLENVMYALNLKLKDKVKAHEKSLKFIKMVKMEDYINKYPSELSGGQQQRVAIARTLSLEPSIILFDEPMSALDADNRLSLRREIKNIQKKLNSTIIYITHDQEEAFSMSDRVMVMNNGVIQQLDTPNNIFNKPKNNYVKKFIVDHLIEKVTSIENCTNVDL